METRSVVTTLREAGPQALNVTRLPYQGILFDNLEEPRYAPLQATNELLLLLLLCENFSSLEQVEDNPQRY